MTKQKVLLGYGCPECKHLDIRYDEILDERYCFHCGLVLTASYHHYGVVFPGLKPIYRKN